MEDIQVYLQEEGGAAVERVRRKILGAAAVAAGASTVWSIASQRRFIRTVPSITANTAIGMTAFAATQEAVRAVRQGDHDPWNSFWAGGIAGAALTRAAYGRGFHLLGLVMWAPICGSLHWLNNAVQPGEYVKSYLASNELLDLPQQQQQQQEASDVSSVQQQQQQLLLAATAAVPMQPRRLEELSHREKKREVELIRQREMEQLNEMLKRQEQQQQQVLQHNVSSEQQTSSRKWQLFG